MARRRAKSESADGDSRKRHSSAERRNVATATSYSALAFSRRARQTVASSALDKRLSGSGILFAPIYNEQLGRCEKARKLMNRNSPSHNLLVSAQVFCA